MFINICVIFNNPCNAGVLEGIRYLKILDFVKSLKLNQLRFISCLSDFEVFLNEQFLTNFKVFQTKCYNMLVQGSEWEGWYAAPAPFGQTTFKIKILEVGLFYRVCPSMF